MRVLIPDSYYEDFLAEHYRDRSGLESRPYADQLASLLERSFGTTDAYSHELSELGHDAAELILNCDPLQRRWAAENGVRSAAPAAALARLPGRPGSVGRQAMLHLVAMRQASAYEADVIYAQDLWFFRPAELRRLRSRGALVAGQIASRAPDDQVIAAYDLIFTSFPHFVERFRALGVRAEYLRIAFDARVLDRLRDAGVDPSPAGERPHAVTHVGALDPTVHQVRVPLLEGLAEETDLEVWGYGVDRLGPASPLRDRYRGQAWGMGMYEVLARSKIVVNTHERIAEGFANNMRLYEATGSGALLITDERDDLAEIFEPGREVVTYRTPAELVERVRHYLAHDDERRAIAAAGQERTLRDHTYRERIAELAPVLQDALAGRRAGGG
jgi:hypothetical protein